MTFSFSYYLSIIHVYWSFLVFDKFIDSQIYLKVIAGAGLANSYLNGPAAAARFNTPYGVWADTTGNVYIADLHNFRVRLLNTSGIVSSIGGTGTLTATGAGGFFSSTGVAYPYTICGDTTGNIIYMTDQYYIWKYNVSSKMVVVYAGKSCSLYACNTNDYGGDGGPALDAKFATPKRIWLNTVGVLYVADYAGQRVRMIDTEGIITTIAGNGTAGYYGDNGPATSAMFFYPHGIWTNTFGVIYVADYVNNRIRCINSTGIIRTIAGNGISGFSGDGGPATLAMITTPRDVKGDSIGNIYFYDASCRVRQVNGRGVINTFIGNGICATSTTFAVATLTSINLAYGLFVDTMGDVYISGYYNIIQKTVNLLPTSTPTNQPTSLPTTEPSFQPTTQPSRHPSNQPTGTPSLTPSAQPSCQPSCRPSSMPSIQPSSQPSNQPSSRPTLKPSRVPSGQPSNQPSGKPSSRPTLKPSSQPSDQPSSAPSSQPSTRPSHQPTSLPTKQPISQPSEIPTSHPVSEPSSSPTTLPLSTPSSVPSHFPSALPTSQPTSVPSFFPSAIPTSKPSTVPTALPLSSPTLLPSTETPRPSSRPSSQPSNVPSHRPSFQPVSHPTGQPSRQPSSHPSRQPVAHPTSRPTAQPTSQPTLKPSANPSSSQPTSNPTMASSAPTPIPAPSYSASPSTTRRPTRSPTIKPTKNPSIAPTAVPTVSPTNALSIIPLGTTNFRGTLFLLGSSTTTSTTPDTSNVYLNSVLPNQKAFIVFGQDKVESNLQIGSRVSEGLCTEIHPQKPEVGLNRDSNSRSVTIVGDINNDGLEDLVLGFPYLSTCLVYLGSGNGFQNLIVSFGIYGLGGDAFGWSVSRAGDINYDGCQDMVICAKDSGICYVLFGNSNFPYNGNIYLQNITSAVGFRIVGASSTINFGMAVDYVGDFNNDGFSDLVVSAMAFTTQGIVYVIFGRPVDQLNEDIILENFSSAFIITTPPFSFAGMSVAGIGDMNNDGFADIAIGGVPYQGGYSTQKSFVIFGRGNSQSGNDTLDIKKMILGVDGFTITGGGFLVNGVGDLNQDGYTDLMISSYYNWHNELNGYLINFPKNMSSAPTYSPSSFPSSQPSSRPTSTPTRTHTPSNKPTVITFPPIALLQANESASPSVISTAKPTKATNSRTLQKTSIPSASLSTLLPAMLPTKPPSRSPTRPPTLIPSPKPTLTSTTRKPTLFPSLIPTARGTFTSQFESVYCYNSTPCQSLVAINTQFIIRTRGTVRVQCGTLRCVVLIIPTKGSVIIMEGFDITKDIIDLSKFPQLKTIEDLSFATNPQIIFLGPSQQILFPHSMLISFTEESFLFSPLQQNNSSGNNNIFQFVLIGSIAVFFISIFIGIGLDDYIHESKETVVKYENDDLDGLGKGETEGVQEVLNDEDYEISAFTEEEEEVGHSSQGSEFSSEIEREDDDEEDEIIDSHFLQRLVDWFSSDNNNDEEETWDVNDLSDEEN